ncbi:MAG TPA: thiamine-phosphate kinase [Sphingomonas sp.]|nr:thiamine-phosphate kinase [Sphingomonas sp.]
MTEAGFLAALRALPLHPGAAGLGDDAARLGDWVLTTDTIVEGVHYVAGDAPEDVAWKLVAVNLSDLAAKGAAPEGALLNYPLSPAKGERWDRQFLAGLDSALRGLACPLLGGDTVSLPAGAPRVITLTAIGRALVSPVRSGARAGDALYVTGTIGDAGAGLKIARGERGPEELLAAYRRPHPRLAEGGALAPVVAAMMDVSDGLLVDAARMAGASGLEVTIDLAAIPLSAAYRAFAGDDRAARLAAATAGDDYELLFAAPADLALPVPATLVGRFSAPESLSQEHVPLTLIDAGGAVALPESLGFTHGD